MGEEAEALDDALDIRDAKTDAQRWRARNERTRCKHGLTEWDGPCFACANEESPPRKATMPAAKKPSTTPIPGPIVLGRRGAPAKASHGLPIAPAPLATPASLEKDVMEKAQQLRQAISAHGTNLTPLPQHALAIAQALQQIKTEAEAALKVFTECVAGWKKIDESIEPGALTVSISTSDRSNPSWKNEAVTQARKLAEANGAAFNEAAYVEGVQKAAGKTPTKTIRVVESTT